MKKILALFFGLLIFAACGTNDSTDSASQRVTYEPTGTTSLATEVPDESGQAAEPDETEGTTIAWIAGRLAFDVHAMMRGRDIRPWWR